eukprot:PhM_4_TR4218/c0_g1_i1/m.56913
MATASSSTSPSSGAALSPHRPSISVDLLLDPSHQHHVTYSAVMESLEYALGGRRQNHPAQVTWVNAISLLENVPQICNGWASRTLSDGLVLACHNKATWAYASERLHLMLYGGNTMTEAGLGTMLGFARTYTSTVRTAKVCACEGVAVLPSHSQTNLVSRCARAAPNAWSSALLFARWFSRSGAVVELASWCRDNQDTLRRGRWQGGGGGGTGSSVARVLMEYNRSLGGALPPAAFDARAVAPANWEYALRCAQSLFNRSVLPYGRALALLSVALKTYQRQEDVTATSTTTMQLLRQHLLTNARRHAALCRVLSDRHIRRHNTALIDTLASEVLSNRQRRARVDLTPYDDVVRACDTLSAAGHWEAALCLCRGTRPVGAHNVNALVQSSSPEHRRRAADMASHACIVAGVSVVDVDRVERAANGLMDCGDWVGAVRLCSVLSRSALLSNHDNNNNISAVSLDTVASVALHHGAWVAALGLVQPIVECRTRRCGCGDGAGGDVFESELCGRYWSTTGWDDALAVVSGGEPCS